MTSAADASVKKSIIVNATLEHAFDVFTAGFRQLVARSHHIGKSPMEEGRRDRDARGWALLLGAGRRTDATGADSGMGSAAPFRPGLADHARVGLPADLSKSSEVEIRFTAQPGGGTRVDLEHRHFERMGPEGDTMRVGVGGPGGWGSLMELFKAQAER
jgi:hypothetical protein